MKKIFKANLFFLTLLILQLTFGYLISPFKNYLRHSSPAGILALASLICVFLPVIIYILISKKPFKETLKFNRLGYKNFLYSVLITFLIFPIANFCVSITSIFFKNNIPEVMNKFSSTPAILFFAIFAIMPAIGEELAMRGVILDGYGKLNIKKAAIINGLLFAILHLNPPQFLYAFVLGIILTFLVYYTNSIFSSMTVHFVFNGSSALSFLYFKNNNPSALEMAKTSGKSFTIITILVSAAIACIAIILIAKILKYLKEMNKIQEKINFYNHTVDLSRNDNSDFKCLRPSKGILLAYTPILISIAIFLFFVTATV